MLAALAVPGVAHAQVPPDTMQARLQACSACHGAAGQGTSDAYFPRLAGKPAGYLYNQLVAFHDGRRRYPPMNYLLEYLDERYLQKIAEYFASLRPPALPPAPSVASDEVLAHGEHLIRQGDAENGLPACISCHGPALSGEQPAIPGLIGLRATYISAQLGAWRYGTRSAAAPDCMQAVAARLTEADVTAVASWLAAQPVPADPAPLPAGSLAMPQLCGSVPH